MFSFLCSKSVRCFSVLSCRFVAGLHFYPVLHVNGALHYHRFSIPLQKVIDARRGYQPLHYMAVRWMSGSDTNIISGAVQTQCPLCQASESV